MGISGSIRIASLDASKLGAMEHHGKRLDVTGQRRRIRDVAPLLHDPLGHGLDLNHAYEEHVKGARRNKGARNIALHAFVQFPTDLEIGSDITEQALVDHAAAFINRHHGDRAVFHARLDRDEAGRHGVDVFFAPLYDKTTARGTEEWVSLTKFGKQAAVNQFGAGKDSSYYQGQAWQTLWYEYLHAELKLDWVERGAKKPSRDPDRLEPEVYQIAQERKKLVAGEKRLIEARRAAQEAEEAVRVAKQREDTLLARLGPLQAALRAFDQWQAARSASSGPSDEDRKAARSWLAAKSESYATAIRRALAALAISEPDNAPNFRDGFGIYLKQDSTIPGVLKELQDRSDDRLSTVPSLLKRAKALLDAARNGPDNTVLQRAIDACAAVFWRQRTNQPPPEAKPVADAPEAVRAAIRSTMDF